MISIVFWFPKFYLPSPDRRWEPVLGENHQTSAGRNHQTPTWLRFLWRMLNYGRVYVNSHPRLLWEFTWSPPFGNVLPPTIFGLSTVYTTHNQVGEKNQFASAASATDMKNTKPPLAVIIKIIKPFLYQIMPFSETRDAIGSCVCFQKVATHVLTSGRIIELNYECYLLHIFA